MCFVGSVFPLLNSPEMLIYTPVFLDLPLMHCLNSKVSLYLHNDTPFQFVSPCTPFVLLSLHFIFSFYSCFACIMFIFLFLVVFSCPSLILPCGRSEQHEAVMEAECRQGVSLYEAGLSDSNQSQVAFLRQSSPWLIKGNSRAFEIASSNNIIA